MSTPENTSLVGRAGASVSVLLASPFAAAVVSVQQNHLDRQLPGWHLSVGPGRIQSVQVLLGSLDVG